MSTYCWNPVFNLFKKIKADYIEAFGQLDTIIFQDWLVKLNNSGYNDIFNCLKVNQFSDFILIRYDLIDVNNDMWSDSNSIYRECRSIVIDVINEEIVLAPFRKFFNLNEVEENKMESVISEIKRPAVILT